MIGPVTDLRAALRGAGQRGLAASRRLCALALLSALILPLGVAKPARAAQPAAERLAIVGGTLIDPGSPGEPYVGAVVTEGPRVIAAGPQVSVPTGARVIDASGKYVLPGLWDMHAHVASFGPPGHWPERMVGFGVLGIRDMGGHIDELLKLRAEIATRARRAPTLYIAGPTLNGEAPADFHRAVLDAAQARQAVLELHSAGVDFIKIHRQMSREAFFAIADETRRLHMTFSGHVPLVMSFIEASNAGMRSVEHVQTLLENELSDASAPAKGFEEAFARIAGARGDEIFAALARNGTFFDPTLVGYQESWAGNDAALKARKQEAYEKMQPYGLRASRAGVRILAGTDVVKDRRGDALLRELEQLVAAGLSPREALAAATAAPSQLMERSAGGFAVGADASLLILDANPLDDVRNVRKLSMAVLRGSVLDSGELGKLRAMQD